MISIVVGSDDTGVLTGVLKAIDRDEHIAINVISVSSERDVLAVSTSVNPAMIILSFRNNQQLINALADSQLQKKIPLLCLQKRYGYEILSWRTEHIVFTFSLEDLKSRGYLMSQIRSIIMLKKHSDLIKEEVSLAHQTKDKERNISRYVLELDKKTSVLQEVKQRIVELFPKVDDPIRTELMSIVNAIKVSAMDRKLWEDFKLYFEEVDPRFLLVISKKHPNLTQKDLKYCCYIKMNMSNDDIRNLLGINQESVRTHKYRLKKKLALNGDGDLQNYIRSIGNPELNTGNHTLSEYVF